MPTPIETLGRRALLRRFCLAAALGGSWLSGCAGSGASYPVDPERARTTLRSALESWKRGDKIESLKAGSPPIVAQDFDWMAGARLDDYAVLDDGRAEDANLRVKVQLAVRPARGAAARKTVTYVVGTDPALTVFRAME